MHTKQRRLSCTKHSRWVQDYVRVLLAGAHTSPQGLEREDIADNVTAVIIFFSFM